MSMKKKRRKENTDRLTTSWKITKLTIDGYGNPPEADHIQGVGVFQDRRHVYSICRRSEKNERRTSNVEWEKMNIWKETEIVVECSYRFLFDFKIIWGAGRLRHSSLSGLRSHFGGVGWLRRLKATSLFDVQCSMLDVHLYEPADWFFIVL